MRETLNYNITIITLTIIPLTSTTILAIFIKMKPHGKPLGHNPLSDAPHRNSGMVLNGQGLGRHPLGGVPYFDLDMVLNEQGSSHRILSDALHRRRV
jgi:hypothetical protein